ncbi:DUF6541 family protein [uncultured Aeromicrobium sp.]|uniref:DUF6541 family protein n=1 Tax=uncultured Aeromicrobium sp. TaxID=337820 RepID=UPI0025D92ACA|nr:DUF6541 family protein [uncultured Aeromicrobium sp.]
MLDWIALTPSVVVAAALLVIPGATLVTALGMRGFGILATGVPVSVTVISGSAIVAPWVGLEWGLIPVAAVWLVLFVMALAVRRIVRNLPAFAASRQRPAPIGPSLAALVLGGTFMTYLVARIPGSPEKFSIRFDNAFHLGATRYALETGNASALHVSGFASLDGVSSPYPAAWHGLMSLVVQLTGVSLPEASNALMIAVAAVAWVSGCIFLGLVVSRHRVLAAFAGAALAGCFHTFPFLLLNWGTLYPNFLGISLLPATMALLAILFGLRGVQPEAARGTAFLVIGAGLPGIVLAHPNTLMVAGLIAVTLGVVGLFESASRAVRRGPAVARAAIASIALIALTAAVWAVVRPPRDESPWAPYRTLPGAIFEQLTNSQVNSPVPVAVAVVIVVGLIVLCVRRQFAFVAVWLVIGVLFVIAAGAPDGSVRWFVSGVFFQDSLRVVALTAVGAMAPAITGAVWLALRWMALVERIARRWGLGTSRLRVRVARVSLAVLAAAAVFTSYHQAVLPALSWARDAYTVKENSDLVDEDELAMIEQLPDLVPDDAVLIGEPRSGTPFAYALEGIRVAPPYMYLVPTEAETVLREKLNRAGANPRVREVVCDAVEDLGENVYVLDFHDGRYSMQFRGLNDLRPPVVEEVAREGSVTLYRVAVCDR